MRSVNGALATKFFNNLMAEDEMSPEKRKRHIYAEEHRFLTSKFNA